MPFAIVYVYYFLMWLAGLTTAGVALFLVPIPWYLKPIVLWSIIGILGAVIAGTTIGSAVTQSRNAKKAQAA